MTHGTAKRGTLSQKAKFTLGQGNLREAVKLPDNEDLNEWLASNIVDFFNEVSLLYGLCADDAQKYTKPGEGFPPGFQYLWADGVKVRSPIKCSSPEYVDFVMTWIEDQINNGECGCVLCCGCECEGEGEFEGASPGALALPRPVLSEPSDTEESGLEDEAWVEAFDRD